MENVSAFVSQPSTLLQNINLENEMGTSNKPPKLLRMEDYPSWADKLSQIAEGNKDQFLREKKMLNLFQQAIKTENFQLLQHNGSCYSIWQALLNKDRGNPDMRKSKMALLKKEFDIFTQVKGETFAQLVERYCHLVNEMKRLGIDKPDYEYIDKLADALPEEWALHNDPTVKSCCICPIKPG
ncbi:uncharacterized protein LOC143635122 [Bidens hawaiensis]|uniref:uncharacterized protein LOC143635122 n=1 Tax=Bidens hawaiensis TaxID=980011 RepID=UPI00404929A3